MNTVKEIWYLFKKDVTLEWRQKYALGGIFLYVLSTVFIIYLSFIDIDGKTWNTLFWIIVLFASVNAVTKSFIQESGYRALFYYTLADPLAVITSKILYNTALLSVISLLTFAFLGLIMGNPVRDLGLFLITLGLGSLGFSITFTFISAIAVKANNSATLMAILSFPVIIPILTTLIKLSASALFLIQDTSYWKDIVILLAIDLILVSLAVILYPLLWRD